MDTWPHGGGVVFQLIGLSTIHLALWLLEPVDSLGAILADATERSLATSVPRSGTCEKLVLNALAPRTRFERLSESKKKNTEWVPVGI